MSSFRKNRRRCVVCRARSSPVFGEFWTWTVPPLLASPHFVLGRHSPRAPVRSRKRWYARGGSRWGAGLPEDAPRRAGGARVRRSQIRARRAAARPGSSPQRPHLWRLWASAVRVLADVLRTSRVAPRDCSLPRLFLMGLAQAGRQSAHNSHDSAPRIFPSARSLRRPGTTQLTARS